MQTALSLNPTYYEALKRLTLELAGIHLGRHHAFLVETRLSVLARQEGFENLESLVEELFKNGQSRLAVQVVSALLERDTHFFSDWDSFEQIENLILPKLYPSHKGGTLRLLSFGCSSGQETYSLAMMTKNCRDIYPNIKFEIVGVDYPSAALDRARAGRFTHFEVQRGLPVRELVRWFTPDREDWLVKPELRECVSFKDCHLLSNLSGLGQFHIVLFRNALPHYSSPAQVRVMRGLSSLLTPMGYLLLGSHDEIGKHHYGLNPLGSHSNILRKQDVSPPERIEPQIVVDRSDALPSSAAPDGSSHSTEESAAQLSELPPQSRAAN